jgi:reactive chlorine resistance protein C
MEGVSTMITVSSAGRRIHTMGTNIIRYGLAVVVAWIGLLKFTTSEAGRIQQYVAHSPFLSWTHLVLDHRALAAVFGCVEVTAAVLILLRRWLPRVSAVGSVLAIGLFLTTLSFLLTTPGVGDAAAGGFPALSPVGQFLLKDVVLLGASVWTLGDSLLAARCAVDPGTHGESMRTSTDTRVS